MRQKVYESHINLNRNIIKYLTILHKFKTYKDILHKNSAPHHLYSPLSTGHTNLGLLHTENIWR